MNDNELLSSSGYIRLIAWIVLMAVPVAILTLIYLVFYKGGSQLVWETIPDTLNISRPVYTIVVATLGGLLVGLCLKYLGVRHGESLQKEMEAGRVPYKGVTGLVVTALIGLISGASVGPEGPLGHLGAAFGSWFSGRIKLSPEKSRIMTLSGISAAFGGYLLQPLTGAFMSMEFTGSLGYPIYANLIAAMISGLIGALVMFSITAIIPNMALPFPEYAGFQWTHLLYRCGFRSGRPGYGLPVQDHLSIRHPPGQAVGPLSNPETGGWRVDLWRRRRPAAAHPAFRRGRAGNGPGGRRRDRGSHAPAAGLAESSRFLCHVNAPYLAGY